MKVKRIGVLTSGGDAPGMNAAVRSVARAALAHGLEVVGIMGGYRGLIAGDIKPLQAKSVSNIIQKGGTILKTARCEEFQTDAGRKRASETLKENGIDGLVVIGGDGSYQGLTDLLKVWDGSAIGVPGTIDNDIYGTDETIGYDTAVNTALDAIDKIRDTADAHERFFLIEVMGRSAGFIALDVGIAGGAEEILIPESTEKLESVANRLSTAYHHGKSSCIAVVAEGEEQGGAEDIAHRLKQISDCDYRVVVLGHIQRGGSPTARDRILATKLGAYAIKCLLDGQSDVAVGVEKGELVVKPIKDAVSNKKPIDSFLQSLVPALSQY